MVLLLVLVGVCGFCCVVGCGGGVGGLCVYFWCEFCGIVVLRMG